MQVQVLVVESLAEKCSSAHRFTASWMVPWWPKHSNYLVVYGPTKNETLEKMQKELRHVFAAKEVRVDTVTFEI